MRYFARLSLWILLGLPFRAAGQEQDCSGPLGPDSSLSGHTLLYECGAQIPEASETCLTASCLLADAVMKDVDGLSCDTCPEACALAMVICSANVQPKEAQHCTHHLHPFLKAKELLESVSQARSILADPKALRDALDVQKIRCSDLQLEELRSLRWPAALPAQQASLLRRAPQEETRLNVAILLASDAKALRRFQPFINLWRCYALRHNYHFILDTDVTLVTEEGLPLNWLRWFAAERHLEFHDYLLVVDPDQFIVPECWHLSIVDEVLADRKELPDVILKDTGAPQTLNNGVVFVRNSPRGRFFLELLLKKAPWLNTIQFDQGAFDETVLEVLGFEKAAKAGSMRYGYDSLCLPYQFKREDGVELIAHYAMCWWNEAEHMAGKVGNRSSNTFRFVDPRKIDINHVVGWREMQIPAFLYHFAGRSKDWDAMLEKFGMAKRHTSNCAKVFHHVSEAAKAKRCVPFNAGVQDLHAYCEPPLAVC
eukprot:TRINITY_DN16464_c1_g1_i1.p1 TRINITY_DN16464_c1_g1~~TRINITY_DN16464_c1_g1_i1.p1  ORF type:complete len:483 (+),score=77.11 TRINITY_DN16464_c1_g1_i1:157-1605(+)